MDNYTQEPTNQIIETEGSHLVDALHLRSPNSRSTTSSDVLPSNFVSPTLKEIAKYGGYSTYSSNSNTDPFIRETLKLYSRNIYEDIRGFTRRPQGNLGMYDALKKFSGEVNSFDQLSLSQQSSMRRSIAKAKKAFRLPYKRTPLDWHEVGPYLRRDTSAGATFMGSKKGEVMEEIYHEARWLGHRMKQDGKESFNPTKVRFPPCLAGQRGGMSDIDEPKTRLVVDLPCRDVDDRRVLRPSNVSGLYE